MEHKTADRIAEAKSSPDGMGGNGMRKGSMKQLMAAVLILCTFLSASICPNAFSSMLSSAFAKSESVETKAEAQAANGSNFCDSSVGVTEGTAVSARNAQISGMGAGNVDDAAAVLSLRGVSGGLGYAAFRRVERVKRSVSWSFSALLFKTAVFSVLVLFLVLAAGGKERTIQMTILSFIHNKDGKKEKTALFT